jgi:general nucleoside transport system ATP-binding protein
VTLRRRETAAAGNPILQIRRLAVSDWRIGLDEFSLGVGAGEVIGLAGLEGSGQRLLLQACAGLRRPDAGHILLDGRDMAGQRYSNFLHAGVSFVPAGRLEEGLIAGMTITEHVALGQRHAGFLVDWAAAQRDAAARIRQFNIKGLPATTVDALSGGNQQRTMLGLLPPDLKVLMMEHPTRGLDLESAEYIWGLLLERTRRGTAIIFSSSDLDELLDRSDRILVFFSGRVAQRATGELTAAQLGELIGGLGF